MKKRTYWIIGIFFFVFLFFGGCTLFTFISLFSFGGISEKSGNLAIIEVKGTILDSTSTVEKLDRYRKNPSIKAVVLRINSPGGAVGPSQEIYSEVKKLAEKKPVVVSMGAVAASGGYYIAAPATKILANPGTITGSIGVLMQHIEVDELLKWAKISAEVLKAGEFKDIGGMLRRMNPEERALLQGILDNLHHQFQQAIALGRHLSIAEVEKLGNGRVYTGEQALELKLVDQLGNLNDAILVAKELGKIEGEPRLIKPEKSRSLLKSLIFGNDEEESEKLINSLVEKNSGLRAMYLMSF